MAFVVSSGVASRRRGLHAAAQRRTLAVSGRGSARTFGRESVIRMQEGEENKGGWADSKEMENVREPKEEELPPEPYPGYYRDMERMGLSKQIKKPKSDNRKVGGKASLYKPDGTPYAPWMIGAVDEEVPDSTPRKSRTDARGRLASDPQAQEVAGVGLRYRALGDELELRWSTGGENSNQGFIVRKRKAKTNNWEKVADFESNPGELTSKGEDGGLYSFLDKSAKPGTWVYRVSDRDKSGNESDLTQTIVEFESQNERRVQVIGLVAIVAVLALLGIVGLNVDPQSNLS